MKVMTDFVPQNELHALTAGKVYDFDWDGDKECPSFGFFGTIEGDNKEVMYLCTGGSEAGCAWLDGKHWTVTREFPIKVMTDFVPQNNPNIAKALTAGKVYDFNWDGDKELPSCGFFGTIEGDNKEEVYICTGGSHVGCAWLDGKHWTVIKGES